MLQRYH